MSRWLIPCVLTLVLAAMPVGAADPQYTFETLDLPAVSGAPGRLLNLQAIANDVWLAGDDHAPNGLGARVDPALTVLPVTCPPEVFPRSPQSDRQGPEVVTMNNVKTVVGNDEHVSRSLYALAQTLDGTCQFLQVPGAAGTLYTTIDDNNVRAGHYFNFPNAAEPGLLRFHAFIEDAAGTITPVAAPEPHSIVFITGRNILGDMVGYLYLAIQPDNSYTYQAYYYHDGLFTYLDAPTGDDLWCLGLNNVQQAVCVVGVDGVSGGQALLYDHVTGTYSPLPDPSPRTTLVFPTDLNDLGAITGQYLETAVDGTRTAHQFLAMPVPPPVVSLPPDDPPPAHLPRPHRRHRRQVLVRVHELREALRDARHGLHTLPPAMRRWCPALDDDGTVVLTNGAQVLGSRGRGH
jgi:hypothetical protein